MSLTSQHTQYSLVTNNGKDWTQIINIFIASLSSLSFGMALAWTSPFIDKIANGTQNYNITKNELILIAPIAPATTIIASPIVTGLNDKIGRKWMVMAISLQYATFWIVTVFAKDAKMFYVSRIFVGIGDAILYTTLALYIGEILTPKVRGVWSNAVVTANKLGVLLVNIIGFYFTVQVTAYISLSAPAMLILLMTFMPESPYYNIMKKRYTAAQKNLRFLRCTENVNDEFLQIKAAVERQMSENGGWIDLIKIKSNRKAVFIFKIITRLDWFLSFSYVYNDNL